MPPAQCPDCGRFLKAALVAALPEGPRPCPACGTELREELFTGRARPFDTEPFREQPVREEPAPATSLENEAPVAAPAPEPTSGSVRPPDLAPETVRDESDVLAGWDAGAGPADVAAWQRDRPPFPIDAVVVAVAAVAGLLLGVVVDRVRRLRGGFAGLLGGAVTAVVVRRLWRLDE